MSKHWMKIMAVALVAATFVSRGSGQEPTFNLSGMGGGAVSPDNVTLVVSLTSKAELVYIDTVAGKETKRVTVEFQPTQMAWSGKVLFVAQKASGTVHVLDASSGKEIGSGKVGGAVRNLIAVNGMGYASTISREVAAIDAKGTVTKTKAQGTFIAADKKGSMSTRSSKGRRPPTLRSTLSRART